jgi:hypothetical protein
MLNNTIILLKNTLIANIIILIIEITIAIATKTKRTFLNYKN